MSKKEISPEVHKIVILIAKILLAIGIIGTIILYTDIFDLLYFFFMFFLIPMMFLAALGVISSSVLQAFSIAAPELKQRIKIETKRLTDERLNQNYQN